MRCYEMCYEDKFRLTLGETRRIGFDFLYFALRNLEIKAQTKKLSFQRECWCEKQETYTSKESVFHPSIILI